MIVISTQAFPPDSGGKQALMKGLADSIATHEPVIVLADKPRETNWPQDSKLKKDDGARYERRNFGGLKYIRQKRKSAYIGKLTKKNKISQIFCDSWRSAERLPANLDSSIIIYAHGNEYPREHKGIYAKKGRIRRALSKADHLIAVSNDTAKRTLSFLPNGLTPTIIHPPIESQALASFEDKTFADALWPNSSVRLLALCRLIELKGIDQAILSLAELRDKNIEAQLVIAGTGDDRVRLEKLVAENNLADRVVFAGRVEGGRKSALFESADIFVQPGRTVGDHSEGFGITYLEAALHGLPTISGNTGGAPEASIDGETGFIIDATQTENVTAAIERLITDNGLRARMSKAARAHGQAALWPKQIERILALKDR